MGEGAGYGMLDHPSITTTSNFDKKILSPTSQVEFWGGGGEYGMPDHPLHHLKVWQEIF